MKDNLNVLCRTMEMVDACRHKTENWAMASRSNCHHRRTHIHKPQHKSPTKTWILDHDEMKRSF